MYYSSTRVIYKVEYNENNLIFYSCLKRYKTNRKVEFQEKNDWLFCYVKWKKTEITILYRNTIKTYPVLGKVRSRIGKEVDKMICKKNDRKYYKVEK